MTRTEQAYRTKFSRLCSRLGVAQRALAIELYTERARNLSKSKGLSLNQAFALVFDEARGDLPMLPAGESFVCDAGLGGLARWLRAIGYEAHWRADIDDGELLEQAQELAACLLTTDSLLMERGVLRDGIIPALWIPPSLKKREQLALVVRELQLPIREPRCMACGGEFIKVDKEGARSRIPPKTYLWLNEFFECTGCHKLFWRGTHWERISRDLERILPKKI